MDLWQQNVSAARQGQAEEERRQNIVSRVVKRVLNQAQAGALERWSTTVLELARQRGIMDRILRRMLNAKMAAGQTAVGVLAACLLLVLLILVYALRTFALCLHLFTCV